jgi:hypothetical protein
MLSLLLSNVCHRRCKECCAVLLCAVVFEVLDNAEGEAEVQKAKDMWAAKAAALQQQQDKEDKDQVGCIVGDDPSSSGASCEGEQEQEEEQSARGEEQEGDQPVQDPKQAGKGYIHKNAPSQRKYVRAHIFRWVIVFGTVMCRFFENF